MLFKKMDLNILDLFNFWDFIYGISINKKFVLGVAEIYMIFKNVC